MAAPTSGSKPKRGKHGGKRSNSGRKNKAAEMTRLEYDRAISSGIAPDIDRLVKSLLALALGTRAERTTDDGSVLVYTTLPDRQAGIYLLDRLGGKPKTIVEVDDAKIDVRLVADETKVAREAYRNPDDDGVPIDPAVARAALLAVEAAAREVG